MIFWLLRKENNGRNTFLVEYENKESAYHMADFLNWLNQSVDHWVLEIN